MSRTRQDIIDTEAMLSRLAELLAQHRQCSAFDSNARTDAESLRRISMTLHRWHELESGNSDDYASWSITRGDWAKAPERRAPVQPDGTRWPREFVHNENGRPFMERHAHNEKRPTYSLLNDLERGARQRLALIMFRYPTLTAYVQGDPRGCALYILTKADVPAGATVDSCYSRGLAVYR